MTNPLAYTVRQCRAPQCRKIVTFPIFDMADAMALTYPHCGFPTDFIEIRPRDRETVCCSGDSDVALG